MKKLFVEYHKVLYWVSYCFYCISMAWQVFQIFFSVLFADDTNMFITGKDMKV